jgi:glycosyltransferase involved in cell wall biosynthesis
VSRVAQVITRFSGGAGVMCLRGAAALRQRGYEVTIVAGSGGRLLGEAAAAGIPTVLLPALRAPISPRHDALALRRLSRVLAGGFDIVHTHCAKAGVLGRLAAHRAGVPRIVHTFHGFPFHAFQPAPLAASYAGIERSLGRITDRALCVGDGTAREAARRGLVPPERLRTIGVAVHTDAPTRTPAARERARAALGVSSHSTVVGVVGRLTYQKAPEDFVAALGLLARPDLLGVWVGGGELAGRVADRKRRVVWAGERADVPELLPALDAFVLPSRYEGLPLAIVEAMVAGVPVVATDVGAVSDVISDGETGLLVPPRRPDRLAAALHTLLENPDLGEHLAVAARERIDGRHTPAELGQALGEAYTEPVPCRYARQSGAATVGVDVPLRLAPRRGPLPDHRAPRASRRATALAFPPGPTRRLGR